jgi:hypothetical protein
MPEIKNKSGTEKQETWLHMLEMRIIKGRREPAEIGRVRRQPWGV